MSDPFDKLFESTTQSDPVLDSLFESTLPSDSQAKSVEPTKTINVGGGFNPNTFVSDSPLRELFNDAKRFLEDLRGTKSITANTISNATRVRQQVPIYQPDGSFVTHTETDEELASRLQKYNELKERKQGDSKVLAGIINTVADPAFSGGLKLASLASGAFKRALAMSGTGSVLLGSDEALKQFNESNSITDTQEIINNAAIGAVTFPLIDSIASVTLHAVAKRSEKKANEFLDKFQDAVTIKRAEGLNPETAFRRAADELGSTPIAVSDKLTKTGRKVRFVGEKKAQGDAEIIKKIQEQRIQNLSTFKRMKEKSSDFISGKVNSFISNVDPFIQPLMASVKKISPNIAARLNKFEYEAAVKAHNSHIATQKFLDIYRKSPKKLRKEINRLWINQDREGIKRLLENNPEFLNSYKSVLGLLDSIGKDLRNIGHKNVIPGGDYLVRSVKDIKGLRGALGVKERTELEKAIRDAEDNLGRDLTDLEKANIINKNILKFRFDQLGKSKHTRSRVLDEVPDELIPYYKSVPEALTSYINEATNYISISKFFGRSPKAKPSLENTEGQPFKNFGVGKSDSPTYNINLENSIGDVIGKELKAGNITAADAESLSELLRARFVFGERAPRSEVTAARNIFYMITLGQFRSALTQLGDLGISAYANGVSNTIRSVFSRSQITPEEIGATKIAEELSTVSGTGRYLRKILKVTGFKSIDRLGKKASINAAFRKFSKIAQSSKGVERIREVYGKGYTKEEFNQLIDDLQNRKVTPLTKQLMFNRLTELQPITLSEMPQKYLSSPNGRILYMLKTFTIKQFDIIRQRALHEMRTGNKTKGAHELAKFATYLALAGMGADRVKAFIEGKPYDLKDSFVSNMYKSFGTSEWMVNHDISEGGPFTAFVNLLAPPGDSIDDVYQDLTRTGGAFKTIRDIPVIGSFVDSWFNGGIERAEESLRRKKEKERRESLGLNRFDKKVEGVIGG